MKIDLNMDFETQFKTEFWKGFSGSEMLCGGIALVLSGIMVFTVWRITGLPINVCVYFGIPVMIPVIFLGIIKYQGHSMLEMFREWCYFYRTRELGTEMEEYQERKNVFTMDQKPKGKGGV
ncbi:PrgI family protein [Roseburia hominis]